MEGLPGSELTQEQIVALEKREKHRIEVIIEQYTECTRALNELFAIAPDQCNERDGLGCCDVGLDIADDELGGPAFSDLQIMRYARLEKEGLVLRNACPYHKKDFGCILGELKSPRCLGHYCEGSLDKTAYSERYVRKTLGKILAGGFDPKSGKFYSPEINWRLVREFKAYVNDLVQSVISLQ